MSLHCAKDENKQKEAVFGPYFKKPANERLLLSEVTFVLPTEPQPLLASEKIFFQ